MPIILLGPLPFLLLKSFFATLLLLCLFRPLSFKLGLVDNPGGRKRHGRAVPLVGGLAIFLGFSILLLPAMIFNTPYCVFWLAGAALSIISGIDDRFHLRASSRFLMHLVVIMTIALFGETAIVQLGNLLGTGIIFLGWGSLFFTGFAVVGIINAVNMMDGTDGLTACVSLVELSLMLFLAWQSHLNMEVMIIVTFMGTLLAFLLFNFPAKLTEKYKVFLGDAGSTLIGLVLAWLCMRLTQRPDGYPPALMLWLVAMPLMDTLHLMINRRVRGVPAFQADRRHIHHICLQMNCSPKQTTLLLSGVSLLIGLTGISLHQANVPESTLFYGMVGVFCMYSVVAYILKKRVLQRKMMMRRTVKLV